MSGRLLYSKTENRRAFLCQKKKIRKSQDTDQVQRKGAGDRQVNLHTWESYANGEKWKDLVHIT